MIHISISMSTYNRSPHFSVTLKLLLLSAGFKYIEKTLQTKQICIFTHYVNRVCSACIQCICGCAVHGAFLSLSNSHYETLTLVLSSFSNQKTKQNKKQTIEWQKKLSKNMCIEFGHKLVYKWETSYKLCV